MTRWKQETHDLPGKLWTLAASSEGRPTDRTMSSLLEKINPADIVRLWTALRGCARHAKRPISWVRWENGTTTPDLDYLADVTAYTTQDGFALRFTVRGTST